MSNILKVKNKKILSALYFHKEGEMAFCEDENQYVLYKDGKWEDISKPEINSNLKFNLYELNKTVIKQTEPLNNRKIQGCIKMINEWKDGNYFLLFGKEIGYFTLLKESETADFEDFGEGVISLLKDITEKIYSIEKNPDNVIEIWIEYEDSVSLLYLCNYDRGVVTYGK